MQCQKQKQKKCIWLQNNSPTKEAQTKPQTQISCLPAVHTWWLLFPDINSSAFETVAHQKKQKKQKHLNQPNI